MALFQFQKSKNKMANEDNSGGEQKNYCLVLNSDDRITGNHNTAQFNINYDFLPRSYEYFKMDFAFQTVGGVYKDNYMEFGGTVTNNVLTVSVYDSASYSGQAVMPNARVTTLDSETTLPSNLYISSFNTGVGGLGTYSLNQTITNIGTTNINVSIPANSNVLTLNSGTANIGYFITGTGLPVGTRIVAGGGTTYYLNKKNDTSALTNAIVTQYVPFVAKVNTATARVNLDFGCQKYIYDTSSQGQSSFIGIAQRNNELTYASNHFKMWWEEVPSQVINIQNNTGTITATILNGDDDRIALVDTTLQGLPLSDMTPWVLFISFTPIPSSAIETKSF
jgi:hypothetical protein